jgi:predicted acyltransferase
MKNKEIKPVFKHERLESLDILRGFDMFWITGGSALVAALAAATGWSFLEAIENQMHHVRWEGFHFYDLIFPLFIFMTGVAIPYAFLSRLESGTPKRKLYGKAFRRFVLLVLFGIIYNQAWLPDWTNPRIASVLGQIGFAYFFAAIIFINFRTITGVVAWMLGIMILYGLVQNFVPVPGYGAGVLTQEGSINAFLDQRITPGLLLGETYEPEGVFNNVSAISIALMGVLAGLILRGKRFASGYSKSLILSLIGTSAVILAILLRDFYPIIKNAWTSTFILLTGGISMLLLALFYLVVDVWKIKKWGFYFKVIGINSITVYLAVQFINFGEISGNFLEGIAMHLGLWGEVLISVGALAIIWTGLYLLYRNRIFLRI